MDNTDLIRTSKYSTKYSTGAKTSPSDREWILLEWLQPADMAAMVGRWGFVLSAIWLLFIAVHMNRGYQDSWILEDLWLPLCGMLIFYALAISNDSAPRHTAALTSMLIFVGYSAPLLKYTYVYGTTIDTSVHFSMMRTLATVGAPQENVYAYTPGFHILVASLAQLSGLSVTTWAKVLPGLMGGLVPLGAYLVCRRMQLSNSQIQYTVVASGLSLPMLYLPNGTTYATQIIIPLFSLLIVRSNVARENRASFTLLIVLLMATLTVWHAVSSLLIPAVMAVSGLLILAFASLVSMTLGYKQPAFKAAATSLIVLGVIGTLTTLTYWRYVATPIWSHLMNNVDLFFSTLETSESSGGVLIPKRTLTLSLEEVVTVFLLYHARDAMILLLCAAGVGFNLYSFVRSIRSRKDDVQELTPEARYAQIIRIAIVSCGVFCLILLSTFMTQFSKYGYQRFLLYVVALCPVIAGYGWWWSIHALSTWLHWFPAKAVFAMSAIAIYFIAGVEIYHPQEIIPKVPIPGGRGETPVYWHHQANTEYQKRGIEFAYDEMAETVNLFTDYKTFQQVAIFLGPEAKKRFHYGTWPSPRPAYVMLHIPGKAGAYAEQAEYRSAAAISERRNLDGISTVYDNGGTFLLQVPQDQIEQMYLEEVFEKGNSNSD